MTSHYNSLTKGMTGASLKDVLEKILEAKIHNTKRIHAIENEVLLLQKQSVTYVQRLGIHRFNPFSDTGGSQSFTLALLDGQDNGVIMTSLYARTGSRWYIKHVRGGKGVDVELSKEEVDCIRNAVPVAVHPTKS